jgi:threonine aldolase
MGLAGIQGVETDPDSVQTNMVFVRVPGDVVGALSEFLRGRGIMIFGQESLRLVTHLDITAGDIDTVIAAFSEFFTRRFAGGSA